MRASYLVVDCSSINISVQAYVPNADSLSNLAEISLILLMQTLLYCIENFDTNMNLII